MPYIQIRALSKKKSPDFFRGTLKKRYNHKFFPRARPPLRPASRASTEFHSCPVPFWCDALPPWLAISRCCSGLIEANPLFEVFCREPFPRLSPRRFEPLDIRMNFSYNYFYSSLHI